MVAEREEHEFLRKNYMKIKNSTLNEDIKGQQSEEEAESTTTPSYSLKVKTRDTEKFIRQEQSFMGSYLGLSNKQLTEFLIQEKTRKPRLDQNKSQSTIY